MDGRNGQSERYRYGYQGSERDDEVKGVGNSYFTIYRCLDTRIARWLSIDPKSGIQPGQSPYNSMNNSPILLNDPHGDIAPLVVIGLIAVFATAPNYVNEGPDNDPNAPDAMKGMFMWSIQGAAAIGGLSVVLEGGILSLTKQQMIEEVIEYGVEEVTGVPIVIDAFDVLEQMYKKGARKVAMDVWSNGRKFVAGTSVKRIKQWAYNVEHYGKWAAEKIRGGWSISQIKNFKHNLRRYGRGNAELYAKGAISRDDMVGGICFVQGTLVKTELGNRTIESIEVNDLVWSYDTDSNSFELNRVLSVFVRDSVNLISKIQLGSEVIYTTPEHPFFNGLNWCQAQDLRIGDSVLSIDDNFVMVTENSEIDTLVRVYNIEVKNNHNYFVGEVGGLVHNTCGVRFYRGGNSLSPRKGVDYKIGSDGFVTERGVSLNSNKFEKFTQKYGGAWELDLNSVPDGLKLKHTGGTHYEIVPSRKMKENEFLDLLKQVKLKNSNSRY